MIKFYGDNKFSIKMYINTDVFYLKNNQILNKFKYQIMNLEAGFQFIIFLVLFGFTNYLIMLKRYENDLKKRKIIQNNKLLNLYPKGTFIDL